MRFEKLSENKIRITLDINDLNENDIDYQSFMSNSTDAQKLFLDMLDKAEKEIGFTTKDYKVMVEALATNDGNFILTITRDTVEEDQFRKKNLRIRRKNVQLKNTQAIYSFSSFDDFCTFCTFINSSVLNKLDTFSKNFSLYTYNNLYFLVINNINLDFPYLKTFYSTISEFGKFVNDSNLFENKLMEHGRLIIKDKAIKTCIKHFVKNTKH